MSNTEGVNKEKEELLKKLEALKKKESVRRENKDALPPDLNNNSESVVVDNRLKEEDKNPSNDETVTTDNIIMLQEGIQNYNIQNFPLAFNTFYKLANEGNTEAKYYLSMMYRNGQGTPKNNERFEFWLGESAKEGYVEAQYAYGKVLLSTCHGLDSRAVKGMKYLGKAADQNFGSAIDEYISISLKGFEKLSVIRKAIKYCNQKISTLVDRYEQQQYKDKKKSLRKQMLLASKQGIKRTSRLICEVGASLFLIMGFVYWFGGMHPDVMKTNAVLKLLIDIPNWMILPFEKLWKLSINVMDTNGKFGIQLMWISFIMAFTCQAEHTLIRRTWKHNLYTGSKWIAIGFIIWHLYVQFTAPYYASAGVFKSALWLVIAFVPALVIGNIIGKIFGLDKN